ncbi:MAG: hypothetical protein GXO39_03200 [Thermotogae bacterium]|nr:hypothetical protein [Thermotogota bacterium]
MSRIFLFASLICSATGVSAQEFAVKVWPKAPKSVMALSPEGSILISADHGIAKLDSFGEIVWSKGLEISPEVIISYSDGFLIFGENVAYAFSEAGSLNWAYFYDFPSVSGPVRPVSATQMGDSIILLLQIYEPLEDAYIPALISLDASNGYIHWSYLYDGVYLPYSVVASNNFIYFTGKDTLSYLVLAKIDAEGNVVLAKNYSTSVPNSWKSNLLVYFKDTLFALSQGSHLLALGSDGEFLYAIDGGFCYHFFDLAADSQNVYAGGDWLEALRFGWKKIYSDFMSSVFEDVVSDGTHVLGYGYISSDTSYLVKVPAVSGALSCGYNAFCDFYFWDTLETHTQSVSQKTLDIYTSGSPSVSSFTLYTAMDCIPTHESENGKGCSLPTADQGTTYDVSGRRVSPGKRKGVFFVPYGREVRKVLVR